MAVQAAVDSIDSDLLNRLIATAVESAEMESALDDIRLSRDELLARISATLPGQAAEIIAAAEVERADYHEVAQEVAKRVKLNDRSYSQRLAGVWRQAGWPGGTAAVGLLVLLVVGLALQVTILTAFGIIGMIVLIFLVIGVALNIIMEWDRENKRLRRIKLGAREKYEEVLLNRGVLPYVRIVMNDPEIQKEYYRTRLNMQSAPGLEGSDIDYQVETAGRRSLLGKLNAYPRGGSFGIAGPRGCGKSSVLRAICDGRLAIRKSGGEPTGKTLMVFVAAPVEFNSRDFLLHLFAEICRSYLSEIEHADNTEENRPAPQPIGFVRGHGAEVGLLLAIIGLVTGFLAIPLDRRAQYLGASVLPRLAKFFGAGWPEVRRYSADITQFIGHLNWPVALAALVLLASGVGLLNAWLGAALDASAEKSAKGRPLQWRAKEMLRRIKFQQSYSSGWSGTLTLPIIQGGANGAVSLAENQMSLPDIVSGIRDFLRDVARKNRVIIAIDELDRIASEVKAAQFLNDVKGIFNVDNCFYLISISEEALSSFELRGMPFRDAFDSAFDEVCHLQRLNYAESRILLCRRVVGLSGPFVLLCHCLGGGLPRDLLRAARELVALNQSAEDDQDQSGHAPIGGKRDGGRLARLSGLTRALVRADLAERVSATEIGIRQAGGECDISELAQWIDHVWLNVRSGRMRAADVLGLCTTYPRGLAIPAPPGTGAAELKARRLGIVLLGSLYYSATLLELFIDDLSEEPLRYLEGVGTASADQLAIARRTFESSPSLAWRRISDFRRKWSMDILAYPTAVPGSLCESPTSTGLRLVKVAAHAYPARIFPVRFGVMAMVGDPAARLGRLGIFADLTEAELGDLAAELDEQTFPEGVWVLRQGTLGTGLFIVIDGEVGVVIDDEERATLTTGSFFGEVSVLLGEPATAGIVVRRPLRCLVIPPKRAERFLIAHPRVMFRMLQTEARRLRTVDPKRD